MTEAQKKAWNCLIDKEKHVLFLQLSYGKSSWEAGGMLKLSHYKYLELKERAEKFFKMFADFYAVHDSIFRPDSPCESGFIDYIEATLEKRMTRKEATMMIGDSSNVISKVRSKLLTRNLIRLRDSENQWDHDTLVLISEFDRWNNFRILPKMMQQPSAYKRRANKKEKIYIKYLLNRVPEWIHIKIIERWKYKAKPSMKKWWICLISPDLYTDGYLLLPIKPTKRVLKEMNRFYIYIFEDRDDADTFGFMVSKFMYKTKGVKLGQKFWPEYRYVTQKAVNYNNVNNIYFNVKSLDTAYNQHTIIRPKKAPRTGETPVDPELFYKK